MWRRLGFLTVVLLVGACGDGEEDEGGTEDAIPSCADVYAEGASVDEAAEVDDTTGCLNEDGGVRIFGFATLDCADGRQLRWNDEGWGYAGSTWHRHERADGQLVPPDAEMDAC